MATVMIGIGCTVDQNLPAEILRFSIECNTQITPVFVRLDQTTQWLEMTSALRHRQRTPFSLQRFILARQILEGSADIGIYLDSDMLVLRPIEGLVVKFLSTGTNVSTVQALPEWGRRHQSSVLVINRKGAELLWAAYEDFMAGSLSYDDLIYLRTIPNRGVIEYSWNCLEYLDESTALLHFTDVETQPWLRDGNPNAGIWYTYLWRFAQNKDYRRSLVNAITSGHVRPSLLDFIDKGPSLTSRSSYSRLKDLFFVPPHRFRKISLPWMRKALAPILRIKMSLEFLISNGQPNIR